jgi:hypothetical protein
MMQAGQIDAVHAPSAFMAALAVLGSNVSQRGLEMALHSNPASLSQSLWEDSDFSPLEARNVESGISDAVLKAGAALLVQGSLEGVGPWSVCPSDYCQFFPEVHRRAASVAAFDKEAFVRLESCFESECLESRPRYSFVLVPAASISQLAQLNSEPLVKRPILKEARPPIPQSMLRCSSNSLPSLSNSSDVTEPVDLLFGESLVQPPASKRCIEARLFVA